MTEPKEALFKTRTGTLRAGLYIIALKKYIVFLQKEEAFALNELKKTNTTLQNRVKELGKLI